MWQTLPAAVSNFYNLGEKVKGTRHFKAPGALHDYLAINQTSLKKITKTVVGESRTSWQQL